MSAKSLLYQPSPVLREPPECGAPRQEVVIRMRKDGRVYTMTIRDKTVVEDNCGFFDHDDMRRIWSDDEYADMRPQLLELMQQFKMAYPLPNGHTFVTPPLLPPAPPEDWTWPDGTQSQGQSLTLYIEYEFLPKALLTQFIVSRHADIDRGRKLVWRNGVVLRPLLGWRRAELMQVVRTHNLPYVHDPSNDDTASRDLHGLFTPLHMNQCSVSALRKPVYPIIPPLH